MSVNAETQRRLNIKLSDISRKIRQLQDEIRDMKIRIRHLESEEISIKEMFNMQTL